MTVRIVHSVAHELLRAVLWIQFLQGTKRAIDKYLKNKIRKV